MSPRPGGETDKVGNRFEGAWTIWHLLKCLHGGGTAITVEAIGDEADGVEFSYNRAHDNVTEVHQLKRQNRMANTWSVKSLHALGIWSKAKIHTDANREYHFVSTLPAFDIHELCDRARRSSNLEVFVASWMTNETLRQTFDELTGPTVYGDPKTAWEVLRKFVIEWHDERHIVSINSAFAGMLLDGAPGALAALSLGDLVLNNLGVELTSSYIQRQLAIYGLDVATGTRRQDLAGSARTITDRWLRSVEREMLDPPIQRREIAQLVEVSTGDDSSKVALLVGQAGAGKSVVLSQALRRIVTSDFPVLGFRLDRINDFATTQELGERLGLSVSPVAALATAANDQPCLLVIDQLDAVSIASGRMPNSFDAIADLVNEASAFPKMRVMLACRRFDVDNDHRIRSLSKATKANEVALRPLDDEEITGAVTAMGLDASKLQVNQKDLLRVPLHLVLLSSVADQPDALVFQTTAHLFDAYWKRKRRSVKERQESVRFNEVISAVANAISDNQRLSVSHTVLDQNDLAEDADLLISENILVQDGNQVAFFHEAFFDYAFARQWSTENVTLVEFLTASEQELFRRAQVRQIMHHLRQHSPHRFLHEVESALSSPDVRFHIKDAILAVIGALSEPSHDEAQALLDLFEAEPDLEKYAWRTLRTFSWFDRFEKDGHIDRWIDSGNQQWQARALDLVATSARTEPDRAGAILARHRAQNEYPQLLRWVIRFADIFQSRPLFDLLVEGIANGYFDNHAHDMWLAVHGLADNQPEWAVELLAAWLVEHPSSLSLDESGKVARLTERDHQAEDLIKKAATARPELFVKRLLPYMKEVMRVTGQSNFDGPGFPPDRHFSHFTPVIFSNSDIDDVLLAAMRDAIRTIVRIKAPGIDPILMELANCRCASAQWLLYNALATDGARFHKWAASLLLESVDRLFCGYAANSVWLTRELLQAILPHIDGETHRAIEEAVRDLRFSWEGRYWGWYAFTLLSALEIGRLTETGRRRLGEFQRKFKQDQPALRDDTYAGTIKSPISGASISYMSDENWLQAMERHAAPRADWETFKGGSRELAHVLHQQSAADPLRFARLGQRLRADYSPAYGDAILMGLGETPVSPEHVDTVFDCIRFIARLGQVDNDRWLGRAIRPYLEVAPIDIVELVCDRALNSPDPVDDSAFTVAVRDEREPGERLEMAGINCARGSLSEILGDLLVYDVNGSRTAIVTPHLQQLSSDPVISVRGQVAHTIAATLRFERAAAIDAFHTLVDAQDELLTGRHVRSLVRFIGNGRDATAVKPVIWRMVRSVDPRVRRCGGELAAHAALQWSMPEFLDTILADQDVYTRRGVALECARRMPSTDNADLAGQVLRSLFADADDETRKDAASIAMVLRGRALRQFREVLLELVDSPAFEESIPQLFITLDRASDRVDELVLKSARRFIEISGPAIGDIRTEAAGNAHYVSDLVMRALIQARDAKRRAALLNIVDDLVKFGAYGVDKSIESAAR
ncbi:nSTAND1 domain-containing NTPase [Amycolatopsis thermoflava]|uniref:NACHT domain-containing protein n=1 Tax=Amycolatopsis thermoflava TaxID=84480 RepID=UPI003F4A24B4